MCIDSMSLTLWEDVSDSRRVKEATAAVVGFYAHLSIHMMSTKLFTFPGGWRLNVIFESLKIELLQNVFHGEDLSETLLKC